MEPITICLREEDGIARSGEPVQLGIPLAKGALGDTFATCLIDPEDGRRLPCQTNVLARWPDGSVRWLKLHFPVDLAPRRHLRLKLCEDGARNTTETPRLHHRVEGDGLHIQTSKVTFRLPSGGLRWFSRTGPASEVTHEIQLRDAKGRQCRPEPDRDWQIVESGPVCLTLAMEGAWLTSDNTRIARFNCRLRFFADSATVQLEMSLHNPQRALHPGGLWDLGDPGSAHFRSLTVHIKAAGSSGAWLQPAPDLPVLTAPAGKELYLYQDSSGGNRWRSRNHINAHGEVTTRFRGYEVRSGTETLMSGDRASPLAGLEGHNGAVQASIRQFWQNFPSTLGTKGHELVIGLFPDDSAEPYELQGGERKTQTTWLHYGKQRDALAWTRAPLVPTLSATHYEQTSALPWFRASTPSCLFDKLIHLSIEGPNNFFAKREEIDEYGWRHFGELFADHETLYQDPGDFPLISHYNNQYDAIYGFARQFALSGDRRWFELMDDLARHVIDIDIYHTDEDRAEYNHGLFWHTDHYLDAHTATHRTFTRFNDTSSTPGQTGGGPAAEHCYTTGLLYHYYLTGCEASRAAVLDLAHWMTVVHEGQGGLFEQLLALRKNELPKFKALMRGEQPSPHRYPFTRGTGNYLNALLDASLLDPEGSWLMRAESVIRNTLHPADDIEQRNLLNVETSWSYLVLLTSVSRYLLIKIELQQRDSSWRYALEAFLHYANWIADNERPFLADPSQLEFPNDTWVAQDIRKAMLLFQAALLDPDSAGFFRQKAHYWLDYSCSVLQKSEQRHFTRILVILMQNHGPHGAGALAQMADSTMPRNQTVHAPPKLTWAMLFTRLASRLVRGLVTFRPSRERAWLNARLNRS